MLSDIVLLETNFVVEWDYNITAHGSTGTAPSLSYPGDPPEPCEYDLEVLALYRPGSPTPLEMPKWLNDLILAELYERDDVNDAVQDAAADTSGDY